MRDQCSVQPSAAHQMCPLLRAAGPSPHSRVQGRSLAKKKWLAASPATLGNSIRPAAFVRARTRPAVTGGSSTAASVACAAGSSVGGLGLGWVHSGFIVGGNAWSNVWPTKSATARCKQKVVISAHQHGGTSRTSGSSPEGDHPFRLKNCCTWSRGLMNGTITRWIPPQGVAIRPEP